MDIESWRAARLAALQALDSSLGLFGLYWLQPGSNRVGGNAAAVHLPVAAGRKRAPIVVTGRLQWLQNSLIC